MVKNWFHSALFLQVSRCLTVPRSWENDKGKQPLKRGGRGPTCHENYVNKVYIYLFIYIIQYTIIYIYIYTHVSTIKLLKFCKLDNLAIIYK